MSEYLTKEEIRKWRSSLERITLEEYAARLGKVIQEDKHDDSLVDSVMFRSLNNMTKESYIPKIEKIQSLSIKSFNKEKEIKKVQDKNNSVVNTEIKIKESNKNEQINTENEINSNAALLNKNNQNKPNNKSDLCKQNLESEPLKNNCISGGNNKSIDKKDEIQQGKREKEKEPVVVEKETTIELNKQNEEINDFSFNKALTQREQVVFDYFLSNKDIIVYAKDLASLLELPKDYVYKYIKNLRTKLEKGKLENADNGGYILKA